MASEVSTRPAVRTTALPHHADPAKAALAAEVRASLTGDPPSVPSKLFYDETGSRLFDDITRLPEYYPTRTEEAILVAHADAIARRTRPQELVELGAGLARKTRLLLDALVRVETLVRCVLVDISPPALAEGTRRLRGLHPALDVRGVEADFSADLDALGPGGSRLLAFLGGTMGNIAPADVPAFLRRVARVLAPGDAFLLGLDLVKDHARLHAAYNDAQGVTAAFNLNILRVLDRALDADFDPAHFEHVAFYDPARAWIEMRLRARTATLVHVRAAGVELEFAPGDWLRTEISCKYTRPALVRHLEGTGLSLVEWMTDDAALFALALLRRC